MLDGGAGAGVGGAAALGAAAAASRCGSAHWADLVAHAAALRPPGRQALLFGARPYRERSGAAGVMVGCRAGRCGAGGGPCACHSGPASRQDLGSSNTTLQPEQR